MTFFFFFFFLFKYIDEITYPSCCHIFHSNRLDRRIYIVSRSLAAPRYKPKTRIRAKTAKTRLLHYPRGKSLLWKVRVAMETAETQYPAARLFWHRLVPKRTRHDNGRWWRSFTCARNRPRAQSEFKYALQVSTQESVVRKKEKTKKKEKENAAGERNADRDRAPGGRCTPGMVVIKINSLSRNGDRASSRTGAS